MIDVSQIRVLNSTNVLAFPVTTHIDELAFVPSAVRIRYDKQGVWTPVAFETTVQESTIWVVANFGGQWVAAGMERLRPNQTIKPEGLDPRRFISEWVSGRDFGPFNSKTFLPGELFGVFVVAGNSRLGSTFIVRERSAIVFVQFPASEAGFEAPPFVEVEGEAPAPPAPGPDPTPVPIPGSLLERIDNDIRHLSNDIQALEMSLNMLGQGLTAKIADVRTRQDRSLTGTLFGYTIRLTVEK